MELRFNSTYEFCDFDLSDQEDLGTYLIWVLERELHDNRNVNIEIVDMWSEGYAADVRGAKVEEERKEILRIFDLAVKEVLSEVEEGNL